MLLVRDDLYITSSSFQEEGGGAEKCLNSEKDVEDENFGACLKMVRI